MGEVRGGRGEGHEGKRLGTGGGRGREKMGEK